MTTTARHRDRRCPVSPGQVQAQAARSVAFLNAIESTVSNLTTDAQLMHAMAGEASALINQLHDMPIESPLDQDGRICELLRQSADTSDRIHERAVMRREIARRDKRLNGADGVEDAYTVFIDAAAALHNLTEDLLDVVLTRDSILSNTSGQRFDSVDALFAHATTRQ